MKEVLILTYFYPPCTLTAAQRPAGWVKHLASFGIKPIVITRNWDVLINQPESQLQDSGSKIEVEKTNQFEVHYLPYHASLRDRLYNSSYSLFKKSSKVLTFLSAIGENYSNRFIPFRNLYDYAEVLISQHTFSAILITGNPFIQFRFGYLLHKKFKIPWVADYRDDWTTSEIIQPIGKLALLLYRIHKKSERKWVGSASLITSVSAVYTDRISQFVKVPGETILNGFDTLLPRTFNNDTSSFVITYNGTLYDTQDVEVFIQSVIRCIDVYRNKITIQVRFPGVSYDPIQEKRISHLIQGYEQHFFLSQRIPKSEVIQLQQSSDVLLMLTHRGKRGIPSSKLYEYLSIQKPILCYPSDNDIVEETLLKSGVGLIVQTGVQLYEKISLMIDKKIEKEFFLQDFSEKSLLPFSVYSQVARLSILLNKY